MRTLLLALLLLLVLLPFAPRAEASDEDGWGRSTIVVDGASYELRCRRVDARLAHGTPADLFVYRVHREGELLHSEGREEGGRFVGCRYRHEAGGPVVARPFPDAEDPIGWMLLSGAICGNTFSQRICLITVTERARSYRAPTTYLETRLVSKDEPLLRRTDEGIEVWTSEQEWGGTGTWGSFFVPRLRIVDPEGRVRPAPLPADLPAWPAEAEGRTWIGILVAGLWEERADLVRLGAKLVPWGEEHLLHFLGEHGLPTSPEGLEDLAGAVDALAEARERVRQLSGPYVGR